MTRTGKNNHSFVLSWTEPVHSFVSIPFYTQYRVMWEKNRLIHTKKKTLNTFLYGILYWNSEIHRIASNRITHSHKIHFNVFQLFCTVHCTLYTVHCVEHLNHFIPMSFVDVLIFFLFFFALPYVYIAVHVTDCFGLNVL